MNSALAKMITAHHISDILCVLGLSIYAVYPVVSSHSSLLESFSSSPLTIIIYNLAVSFWFKIQRVSAVN